MLRLIPFLLCASAFATTTITMDNSAILYSPYNWLANSSYAKTINPGAYFRTIFSGTSLSLTTATLPALTIYPELWYRVDQGPWTMYHLAAGSPTISCATGLDSRKHSFEIVIKSIPVHVENWNPATSWAMVTITGIVLDTSATLTAPVRKTKNILIYGDSISAGLLVHYSAGLLEIDWDDILADYTWALYKATDAEVGIVAFGGTGVTTGYAASNVPALPTSYSLLWSGQSRTFSPAPDLVVYNEGTNDSGSNTAGLVSVISAIIAAAPASKHLMLGPFNGSHTADLAAVVAAVKSSSVQWANTAGWWNSADSPEGGHPYDYAHTQFIAPKLFPLVQKLLYQGPVGFVQ